MKILTLYEKKTWLTNLSSFLKNGFAVAISVVVFLSLMPTWSVLADDISNSSENVPNIWKCIGCPSGQVGTKMSLEEQLIMMAYDYIEKT